MVDEKQKGVTLTLTEDCNLSCVYCYEKHKTDRIMDYDTAKKILDHELTVDDGFGSVTIDFFGGEPFLEFDLMQQICEYVWNNTWPKNYIFFASTNGTLLHGNIKNWLTKHRDKFWVGLSFDGNEKMQNVNRCNSYDMIDLDFFRENWPNQGVKMTISDATLSSLEQGCMFYIVKAL